MRNHTGRRLKGDIGVKSKHMKGRSVHLIDLENLVGSGHVTEETARYTCTAYAALGVVGPNDQVIVAVSHHNLWAAWYGWPHVRCEARSGPDGADLLLQEIMASERLAVRFDLAVLATGDGGFAAATAALIEAGLPVGVIAPRGRLSARLRLAANAALETDFDIHSTPRSA